ncbi:YwcJ [Bacillus atrophaeus UCMB-5137]|nr:YwcJ [Bacillus atrophaeus UCMB-5137]
MESFFHSDVSKRRRAKLFAMMLFVFCFFISGYEHSIANICTFAIALSIDHPDTVTLMGAVRNLMPVTLGNLTAGTAMMRLLYHSLNADK